MDDGAAWWIAGEIAPGVPIRWWHNPALILPEAWRRVVQLYHLSRGGEGRGWLPEAGGINDQPAWLLRAFAVLAAEEARLRKPPGKSRS